MDFSKIRNYLFIALLALVTILFGWLLKPFVYPIFWAVVIAALFYPAYQFISRFFKNHTLSALVSVIIITLIILVPLLIVTTLLLRETLALYTSFNSSHGSVDGTVMNATEFLRNNSVARFFNINQQVISDNISKIGTYIGNFLFTSIKSLTQNSLEFVALFIIMLYSLFFFLRDGERLLGKLMLLSPLGSSRERSLYQKFTATASSMIRGTILIGTVQGALGGILLAIVGIQSAVIWGIIMVFASIIPGVGAALVWVPAGIYLLATHHIWQAIVVFIVGATLISTIDNFLRPLLVGKEIKMHPLLILFSTLGGIALFGVSGFLIGPIITSLFITFWEMYEESYQNELQKN
jgi:predicted PurR-regulated permease PerM